MPAVITTAARCTFRSWSYRAYTSAYPMEAYLYSEMFKLERDHWWFSAKHRIVLTLLRRALTARPGKQRVADLGCGCGRMLQLLADRYDATGVDASPLAVEFAKERHVKVVQGTAARQSGARSGNV